MPKKIINIILGDLQEDIMEIIWELKSCTVRDVLNNIKRKKKPAYTTVMTCITRLFARGILKRRMVGITYIYSPTQKREEFYNSISREVINKIKNCRQKKKTNIIF